MGCGGSEIIENKPEIYFMSREVEERVLELKINNPFYKMSLRQFNKIMEKFDYENDSIEYILQEIQEPLLINNRIITKKLFKDIINLSYQKFHFIFPNDKEINIIIFYLLYFFLTEKEKTKEITFTQKLTILFNKISNQVISTKKSKEKEYIIKTGKFSFLTLNLIQFCTYVFVSLFAGPAVLEIMAGIKKEKVEDFILGTGLKKKEFEPENINKIFNKYIKKINSILKPHIVYSISLADVLQPISDEIMFNENKEEFQIKESELNYIIKLLIEKMSLDCYIALFFYRKKSNDIDWNPNKSK